MRAANACWSAPQGALERVQAILRRLERQQSELLRRAADDEKDAVSRIDDEIAEWAKRRDRVEAILRKKLPPHAGRESGVSAVRAVRALALRINASEGRSLSAEEAALMQQADEHERNCNGARASGIVTNPPLPALPAVPSPYKLHI